MSTWFVPRDAAAKIGQVQVLPLEAGAKLLERGLASSADDCTSSSVQVDDARFGDVPRAAAEWPKPEGRP